MAQVYNRRSLVQRHRGKLLLSLVSVTALFTTGSIIIYLVKRWLYRQQVRISEQQFVREQMRRRFVHTQEDSLNTVYQLVPVFALVLDKDELRIDELFNDLKGRKLKKHSNEENMGGVERSKAELWNELKLKSVTKIVTLTYTISTLFLLTRLQLNMLTRREYLESAINMAVQKETVKQQNQFSIVNWISDIWNNNTKKTTTDDEGKIDDGVDKLQLHRSSFLPVDKVTYTNEQAFLSLSWWLLNHGFQQFKHMTEEAVLEEFDSINPRDVLTLETFSGHLSNVFQSINKEVLVPTENRIMKLKEIILPNETDRLYVLQQVLDSDALAILQEDDTVLRRLIHETTQCVESTASGIVLEGLINESYQYIMNDIESKIQKKPQKDTEASGYQMAVFSIVTKDSCRDMLPNNSASSVTNEYLQRLDTLSVLDDLSASVYGNFNI